MSSQRNLIVVAGVFLILVVALAHYDTDASVT